MIIVSFVIFQFYKTGFLYSLLSRLKIHVFEIRFVPSEILWVFLISFSPESYYYHYFFGFKHEMMMTRRRIKT